MKFNLTKRLVLLGLLFCGLSFTSQISDLHAQSSLGGASHSQLPTGPFVTSDHALTILKTNMSVVKEQMAGLTEGTQSYRDAYGRYMSRSLVYDHLVAGKTVPESIHAASIRIAADEYGLTKGKAEIYRNEVIALLRP